MWRIDFKQTQNNKVEIQIYNMGAALAVLTTSNTDKINNNE